MKNRFEKTKKRLKYLYAVGIAAVLLLSSWITTSVEFMLKSFGILSEEALENSWYIVGFVSAVTCAIIGFALSGLTNRFILRPINVLLDGMDSLAGGNFAKRLDFGKNEAFAALAESFNALAEELSKTEILRNDFINNFSHEFKTPIVSIKGLISLLESGRVPPEKEKEYLAIIEEEIDRLSSMTTNVLMLTKIENQGILTNNSSYNLSEQIRTCILLEEKKWTEKKLELSLDFDEYTVRATEDLMKQVWLNLIDNAIKYSPRGGELRIEIGRIGGYLEVSVINSGNRISEEDLTKIFTKFYQADKSRSKSGNGIGLSIVKSIVELHGGTVRAESAEGKNTFTVRIPA